MTASGAYRRRTGSGCAFCASNRSTYRIATANLGYDETACSRHTRQLEEHADATLGAPGVTRHHLSSSSVRRGVAIGGAA